MFELIKTGTKIDFIGQSKKYFTISIALCLIVFQVVQVFK